MVTVIFHQLVVCPGAAHVTSRVLSLFSCQPQRGVMRANQKSTIQGFPGGSVVRNLPANAGDSGSIPDLRRSCMLRGSWICALEPGNRNYWAHMPHLLKPTFPRACALQQVKLLQWEACSLQPESSTHSPQLEKSPSSRWMHKEAVVHIHNGILLGH